MLTQIYDRIDVLYTSSISRNPATLLPNVDDHWLHIGLVYRLELEVSISVF